MVDDAQDAETFLRLIALFQLEALYARNGQAMFDALPDDRKDETFTESIKEFDKTIPDAIVNILSDPEVRKVVATIVTFFVQDWRNLFTHGTAFAAGEVELVELQEPMQEHALASLYMAMMEYGLSES